MRITTLLREALASTWAAKIPSLLIGIVAAAMCLAPILTVGKTASAAAAMADSMDQAGSRRLVVIDTQQAGFVNVRTLAQVQGLNTVSRAAALGSPTDATNGVIGPGGTRAPIWPVIGRLDDVATLVAGRWPRPGEVIVAVKAMGPWGLSVPVGHLTSPDGLQQWPIVGAYRPVAGFDDLHQGALTPALPTDVGRELRVTLTSIGAAESTVSAVLSILEPPSADGVYVESPSGMAQTARALNAQLAHYGRSLLLMILGAGSFFVAAVVLADVLVRRKDLGRRRTLGATRADLTALVALRAVWVAMLGAAVGCVAGWWWNHRSHTETPLGFTVAIGVLAVVAAAVAAIPPAAFAARRDPVTVMRTP